MTNFINFDQVTLKNLNLWLSGDYDEKTKHEIQQLLKDNPKEIIDSFYSSLTFGTAGLRGIMGLGTNRVNVYTIRAATQALANYIKKNNPSEIENSLFIGYDSRHHSREFAEESAKVLAANGIRVYLCKDIRPTPLISFGCRFKHCSAAIMITASHNPSKYNGYKVYWNDGGQILPPHDMGIIAEYNLITDPKQVKIALSLENPYIHWLGEEIDIAYLEAISKLQLEPEENQRSGNKLKVVYTALHGTGITLMPSVLSLWGFNNVTYVDKQNIPEGDFSTVSQPNPEEKAALSLGIQTLEQVAGDILIATDPDADRVGVAFSHQGHVELLNGNQIACLCLEHICSKLTLQKKLAPNAAFVKSIITTELFKVIAESYQRKCFDVLTGFKYIAQIIRKWEESQNGLQFIFGGEESYGYLLGTQTRDKDAMVAGALICEVALHAKLEKKTLLDKLYDIYRKYGVFYEQVISLKFEEGKEGRELIAASMRHLRKSPPKQIDGFEVVQIDDYQSSIKWFLKENCTESISLGKANVLTFWLSDKSKVMIRPSGTEPKIKIYCGVTEQVAAEGALIPEIVKNCEIHAEKLANAMKRLVSSLPDKTFAVL